MGIFDVAIFVPGTFARSLLVVRPFSRRRRFFAHLLRFSSSFFLSPCLCGSYRPFQASWIAGTLCAFRVFGAIGSRMANEAEASRPMRCTTRAVSVAVLDPKRWLTAACEEIYFFSLSLPLTRAISTYHNSAGACVLLSIGSAIRVVSLRSRGCPFRRLSPASGVGFADPFSSAASSSSFRSFSRCGFAERHDRTTACTTRHARERQERGLDMANQFQ